MASLCKHTLNVPVNYCLDNVEILVFPLYSHQEEGEEHAVQCSRSEGLGVTNPEHLPCNKECPDGGP